MDDNAFNKFVNFALNQLNHKNNFNEVNTKGFVKELHQLRESKHNIIVDKDSNIDEISYRCDMTIFRHYDPVPCWFPGKFLMIIIGTPLGVLFVFIAMLLNIPTFQLWGCDHL
jgi:hypothetical protein